MDNLQHYYKSIYDEASIYVTIRKLLLAIFFVVLGASIYASGVALYSATAAIVILQSVVWVLKVKVENLYRLAHNFQRHAMIASVYSIPADVDEIGDLKQRVSFYVNKKVKKRAQSDDIGVERLENNVDSGEAKLKSVIHENCYFNRYLYRHTFNRNLLLSTFFALAAILPAIFYIPFIKLDPDLKLPRLIFTLLSFVVVYEFLEATLKYRETSSIMKSIDYLLSSKNEVDVATITEAFARYNEAKLSTPHIPASIYRKYEERLNEGWNQKSEN